MKILITENQMKRLLDTVVLDDEKESTKPTSIGEINAESNDRNREPKDKKLKSSRQNETNCEIDRPRAGEQI